MAKTDMVASPELTGAKKTPDIVKIPAWQALAIDGQGAPGDDAFQEAVGALYGIGYTLRFTRKDQGRPVFKVAPLVGEWRAEGVDLAETGFPSPETWRWRMMIPVPDDVTAADFDAAVQAATTKKGGKLEGSEAARRVALVRNDPARCARILHIGPYATEPESFEKIGAMLAEQGLDREPWHIEVYLSDPGRTAPEKLKTGLLVHLR
jgi:hypothetical protein